MNLLEIFHDQDTLIDCAISIIKQAKKQGFKGFSGDCGQAAILINECLFDNSQQIFAAFNEALSDKNHHIGHVACLIDLPNNNYFILDADAQLKSIDDIEHWGMLDLEDQDYQELFDSYLIEKSDNNFYNVSQLTLTQEFVLEHFDCSNISKQRKILVEATELVVPLFLQKTSQSLKKKIS